MSWRRLCAIARKEWIQVRRDPSSLTIAILLPLIQIILIGYGARLDAEHIPVYVYDQEGSQSSQDLLKRFEASRYFDVRKAVDKYSALTNALDSERCSLAVVIPWNFSHRLASAGTVKVQALVDGTDNNTAQLALGYAQAVVQSYSANVQKKWFSDLGMRAQAVVPLVVESRTWFNESLESKNFIIPGAVAMVMALIGALLASLTIAREWERGTMEQLIATPVTALELMVGKLVTYFAIGMLDAAFCVALAVWWFAVPFRGSLGTLFLVTALFLAVILGIGYAISVVTRNQVGASQYAVLITLLPTTMLSGFAFPIDQMPSAVRAISYLVYSRYYVTALKDVFLKGSTLHALQWQVAAMVVYAAAMMFLAARSFRKRL